MPGRKRAARAYRAFQGQTVRSKKKAHVDNPPATLWTLGELVSVVYKRPSKDEPVPYEHKFKKPRPLLCTDPKGRRLFIVGGGYRVRPNGIVR